MARLAAYFLNGHWEPMNPAPQAGLDEERDQVTDAVLAAARVLIGVATRSIAAAEQSIGVNQFRALVVIASRGPLHSAALAEAMGLHPSNATRACDRLVAAKPPSPAAPSATPPTGSPRPPAPRANTPPRQAPYGTTAAPSDRPASQQAQVAAAGLTLRPNETLAVHYHVHLDVIVDQQPIPVRAELGINQAPDGSASPHGVPGVAPVHTHDDPGMIHIEAPTNRYFTLGQVSTGWGVALARDTVGS